MVFIRMTYWLLLFGGLFVCVYTQFSEDEECSPKCVGEEYVCLNSKCYCADGFLPNRFQNSCVKCPGLGEKCFGPCCSHNGNTSLHCWYGICQPCTDPAGNWICRDSLDQILLVTTTQAIMGTALILGIIATFVLLFKLCATTDIRPMGRGANYDSRLSIGSLQLYVDERLRNAPPRYSRTPATTDSSTYPAISYLNDGFVHDCSVPPPPYTEEVKDETLQPTSRENPALHI
ncbi:uncharacterized protein LOC106134739 [Amyelois transitella]|uniref:uncharacterized protein LOC106134739 n=1 Tax=Amyelois transitella TaxID=680683 RepID=UPI00067AB8D9|nr:uncharacterized protein LOC106134739 [Amyelois transitella]